MNTNQFIDGQKACSEGKPCPTGVSKDFERGYAAQYELEQVLERNPKIGEKK
jgi:hypothetical protein